MQVSLDPPTVEASISALLKQIGGKDEELRNSLGSILDLSEYLSKFSEELPRAFGKLEHSLREHQRSSALVIQLNARLEEEQKASRALHLEHDAIRAALAKLETELEMRRIELAGLATRAEMSAAEAQDLRGKLTQKEKLERSHVAEMAALKADNEKLNAEGASLSKRLKDTEKSLVDASDDRRLLRDRIAQEAERSAELSKSLEEMGRQSAGYKREALESSAELDRIRGRIGSLEAEVNTLLSANESLRSESIASETLRVQLKNSYEAKIEALTARVRVTESLLNQSREELRTVSEKQLSDYQKTRDLEKQLGASLDLKSELDKATSVIKSLEQAQEQGAQRTADLLALLNAKDDLARQAADRIELLQRSNLEAEKLFNAREQALVQELAELRDLVSKEQTERSFLQGALETARRDRVHLQKVVTDVRLKKDRSGAALEAAASEIESEIGELTTELRAADSSVVSLWDPQRQRLAE